MSTNQILLTCNLYARDVKQWKIFIVENMMCSRSWPKDVKLLTPSLGTEEVWLKCAIVPESHPAKEELVEIVLKNGVLSQNSFKGRRMYGQILETGSISLKERLREYICSGGSVLTFIYQKPEKSPSRKNDKDVSGWYEKLKMLWKENGIVPRWDKETCRRENGEREFMATMRDPPCVLKAPKPLDEWEKKRLDDNDGSWRWVMEVGTQVKGWAWGTVQSYRIGDTAWG